jgi:hypothetical protein
MVTLQTLLHIATAIASFAHPNEETLARINSAAADLLFVTEEIPEEHRDALTRVAFEYAGEEAGFYASPAGSNDSGSACGVLQVHWPEVDVKGATCDAVRADRKLGFRVGLLRMHRLWSKCGSLAAGLNAYSTNGTCTKQPILSLVRNRCQRAGLTRDCR